MLEYPGDAGRGQVSAATRAIVLQRRYGLELRGMPIPIAVETEYALVRINRLRHFKSCAEIRTNIRW